MKQIIASLVFLFIVSHTLATPLDHHNCIMHITSTSKSGVTIYTDAEHSSFIYNGKKFYSCQHKNNSSLPTIEAPFTVLCDGSNQYLYCYSDQTQAFSLFLVNDEPIEGEPHLAQAPQG